ncbi:MAG TPA: D-aminoacyl-tRNA deacylase [Deltaproteobacteria bacterium]|nr:D-aminoacyl-tRNA deacylase [Deltaproteobacteria bacterium]HPR54269.1 D-aminoacyl-tRNA deacylase [Deltaproteobacteria bacterium]HXK45819.1 D-aminoacyl-tRNA deacylase [Deltaproteobacteria bacterium]
MRAVIQRVTGAAVAVDGAEISRIGTGLCCLIGIEADDGDDDFDYIARKIVGLRIFDDPEGVMNRDIGEALGDLLLISQFTLLGDARKGRRPSYSRAEGPETARKKFDDFVARVKGVFGGRVETGKFQATMEVTIINHGPVTILLDSRKLF